MNRVNPHRHSQKQESGRRRLEAVRLAGVLILVCLMGIDAASAQSEADLSRMRAMVESRDYIRAQNALRQYVEQNPEDAEGWELLGRAQKGRWMFREAAASYERAIALGRESALLLREWIEAKGRGTSTVSLVFKARRLKDAALRVLELDPYDVDTRGALAAYYYVVPGFLGGDKKRADRLVQELVELSPADGYYLLGLRAKEEEAEADVFLGHWQTALRYNEAHTLTLVELGAYWTRNDSAELGLDHLHRAAESSPDDPAIHTALARGYRRIAESAPDESATYTFQGRVYRQAELFDESAVHFRKALEVDPFHAPARLNLAEYYEKHGTKEEAIREYSLLARHNPTYQEREVRRRLARLLRG